MQNDKSEQEFLWKQYDQLIELYKFYFGLTIQIYLLFYGITGGILTFYFANPQISSVWYSLLLPIVVSFLLGMLFLYGSRLMRILSEEVSSIAEELDLNVIPDTAVLIQIFRVSSVIFVFVGIAILSLVLIR